MYFFLIVKKIEFLWRFEKKNKGWFQYRLLQTLLGNSQAGHPQGFGRLENIQKGSESTKRLLHSFNPQKGKHYDSRWISTHSVMQCGV